MDIPITLSERDLRALLGIVRDHRGEDPGGGLPLSLLRDLMAQVPSDSVSLFGLDSRQQEMWFGQEVPSGGDSGDLDVFWEHYWDCLPCSYPDQSGDVRSITRNSDFYSAREWRATGMYNDYLRPGGFEHELMLCLPGAFATAQPHYAGSMPGGPSN
jgi:hypothetical protein